jgi:hypothetical protein
MADHSPSKLSPTADSFTPGGALFHRGGDLQFTRQKEEVTTVREKFQGSKPWPKNKANKYNKPQQRKYVEPEPQSQPQAVYYMDEETLSNMCEAKRKALQDGMTVVCVGCGAFGKKALNMLNPVHNWSSIMETDYLEYTTKPLCPFAMDKKKK